MIVQRIPLFEKGKILTQEMLHSLKEHSMNFSESTYVGYSDGILRGCEISISGNSLTMNQGMLLYNYRLYIFGNSLSVNYQPVQQEVSVSIQFGDETRTEDFIYREAELVLSPLINKKSNSIELCRFKFQEGAMLRNNYQDFADYNTEFNTVNEIYASWSAFCKPSISPKILRAFATEAMPYALSDSLDYIFCQFVFQLKGETLNRDMIISYTSKKLNKKWQDYTNLEIYQQLSDILDLLKNNSAAFGNRTIRNQPIVIS
jgi:hypothetical protein